MKNYYLTPHNVFKTIVFSVFLALLKPVAYSQPFLVKDIATGSESAFQYGSPNPVALNGKLIFVAYVTAKGSELWVSDGTAAGTKMLKDIRVGSTDAGIRNLYASGNYVYFFANDGTHGNEVWRTDGTATGTILIQDIAPGTTDGIYSASYSQIGFPTDSAFYFIGYEPVRALYVTHGQPGDVVMIRESSALQDIVANWNGEVVFTEYSSGSNYKAELWKTDGTPQGTSRFKEQIVSFSGISTYFIPMGDQLLFVMGTPNEGWELWQSDGTPDGTTLVKDVAPGSASAIQNSWTPVYRWNNAVYFIAFPGTKGQELWKSDGTESGTVLVKTLPDRYEFLAAGVGRLEMATLGDELVFTAFNETNGYRDLWKTDGTEAGTVMLASQQNGTYLSPGFLTAVGAKVFFAGGIANKGRELCQTDGSVAGTGLLADIYSGGSGSEPARFTVVDSVLYFSANQSATGYELYKYVVPAVSVSTLANTNTHIKILPNPANGLLTLNAEESIRNLSIYTAAGALQLHRTPNSRRYTLSVQNWPDGVYFVHADAAVYRLLVQH